MLSLFSRNMPLAMEDQSSNHLFFSKQPLSRLLRMRPSAAENSIFFRPRIPFEHYCTNLVDENPLTVSTPSSIA
jgi:hypothetical protein